MEDRLNDETSLTIIGLDVSYDKCCCWFNDIAGNQYFDPMFEDDYFEGQSAIVEYEINGNTRWVRNVVTIDDL